MSEHDLAAFKNLHQQDTTPLILDNIWDAASAAIVQKRGANALATSSASLAWANGYTDGGAFPVNLLINAVKNICRVSRIPLSVDIENGYSDDPLEVAELVNQLHEMGVVGINIEDGSDEPALLCEKIIAIRQRLPANTLFINARTDVYLAQMAQGQEAMDMAIQRQTLYQQAGADGAFVPGLDELDAIGVLVRALSCPVNIMSNEKGEFLQALARLGVKRISRGPFTMLDTYQILMNQQDPEQSLDFAFMQGCLAGA